MHNESQIQKTWNEGVIRDFISRMVLYYDPMDLIIAGAPDDEYDSYVSEIYNFLLEDTNQDLLEQKIYDMFKNKEEYNKDWQRKAKRMAEDLSYILETKG